MSAYLCTVSCKRLPISLHDPLWGLVVHTYIHLGDQISQKSGSHSIRHMRCVVRTQGAWGKHASPLRGSQSMIDVLTASPSCPFPLSTRHVLGHLVLEPGNPASPLRVRVHTSLTIASCQPPYAAAQAMGLVMQVRRNTSSVKLSAFCIQNSEPCLHFEALRYLAVCNLDPLALYQQRDMGPPFPHSHHLSWRLVDSDPQTSSPPVGRTLGRVR